MSKIDPKPVEGLRLRKLTPRLWPALEELFGENGACGGCWCMFWRTTSRREWEAMKGDGARRRLKSLVEAGKARGVLAFVQHEPVGWCTYGVRAEFPGLARARTLRCDDASSVGSIPCFFIRRDHRGRGIASALLAEAVRQLEKDGLSCAEGYPVKPPAKGGLWPAAFAWTGAPSMFRAQGFRRVGSPAASKQRMRKPL